MMNRITVAKFKLVLVFTLTDSNNNKTTKIDNYDIYTLAFNEFHLNFPYTNFF